MNKTSFSVISWIACILSTIIGLIIVAMIYVAVPKFEMIYKDLGIGLPQITEILIIVSRNHFWFFIIAANIGNLVKEFKYNGQEGTATLNGIALSLNVMLLIYTVMALFVPLMVIIEAIGQSA